MSFIHSAVGGEGNECGSNGRGIPLSDNGEKSREILQRIFSGHPISSLEYSLMGDFRVSGVQTVNSLCESLQICVYRDGKCFQQDYVRGIAQHNVLISESGRSSGMEIVLKPDSAIFGKQEFSKEKIMKWVWEKEVKRLVKLKL